MRTDIVGWLRLQWDRAGAWACVLAGVITLFVGWLGVSETAYTAKQLPYIAGCGLGGMFLLGLGAMLWLSADLRDEWRKLDRIERAIRESGSSVLPPLGSEPTTEQTRVENGNGDAAHRSTRPTMAAGRS
ncbi:hypothetical protein GCM10009547_12740 [Sporichthya brevicatena]|uniref:YiaAB two helix domain-containing protein n=1 Tax=Sporichthya brevicatena TaxID=171442 RepID=A0ABN1GIE9_9ACTN